MRRSRAGEAFSYTTFLSHTFPFVFSSSTSWLIPPSTLMPLYHYPILIRQLLDTTHSHWEHRARWCFFGFVCSSWLAWSTFDWLASVGSIFQTGFANLHLRLREGVCVIKCTMSGGKAKVLSKKPSRTFVSITTGMDKDKAIRHYLDEHATLPTAWHPCHPGPVLP